MGEVDEPSVVCGACPARHGRSPMTTKVALALRVAGCAAVTAFLPGCPNPDLYTTPRTIDPGTVQFQVALEGIRANYNGTQTTTTTNNAGTPTTQQQQISESFILPMVPTVGVRVGLADGLELGARI